MNLDEKSVEKYTRAEQNKRKYVAREEFGQLDNAPRSMNMEQLRALTFKALEGGQSVEQLSRLRTVLWEKRRQGASGAETMIGLVEVALNEVNTVRPGAPCLPMKSAAESKQRVRHGALQHQFESESNSSIVDLMTNVPISTSGIPAQVTQIPIGQGDCYLLILPPEKVFGRSGFVNKPFVAVIDCGTSRSRAKKTAANDHFFTQIDAAFHDNHINPTGEGWDGTIDILIVTHPHYDHYSAFPSLLEDDIRGVRRILLGGGGDDWNTIKASKSRKNLFEKFQELVVKKDGVFDPSVIDADDADVLDDLSQQEKEAMSEVDAASEGTEDTVHGVELLDGDPLMLYRSANENFELEYIAGFKDSTNANDESLILVLRSKDLNGKIVNQMLFTGHAGEPIETMLIDHRRNDLSPTTVLGVGHHGSKTSSSQRFLNAVNPIAAFVSHGINMRYRHPTKVAIDRLLQSVQKVDVPQHPVAYFEGKGINFCQSQAAVYTSGVHRANATAQTPPLQFERFILTFAAMSKKLTLSFQSEPLIKQGDRTPAAVTGFDKQVILNDDPALLLHPLSDTDTDLE